MSIRRAYQTLHQCPEGSNREHSPIARLMAETRRKPALRSYRCSFNWPTVYFANASSPVKLSGGEDLGD